jgi:uncharacterized membrane protein
MKGVLANSRNALVLGAAIAFVILVLWTLASGVDRLGLVSIVLRYVHVGAAMVWIGMIWFVNFIQLAAVQQADEAGRGALMRLVVPRVAETFLHASTITVVSGVLLLVTSGYLLDRWVFSTAVYVSTPKWLLVWAGVLGGFAMMGIAHGIINPSLKIVLANASSDPDEISRARERVATFARVNLLLALPVTFVMVAASHFI